ncbi:Endoglucanase [bioreactor metagenome]|uniref:Endoglucanase n=1 Tax=bioreactor metagenome TaxID=1076179 RepID=A0A645D566_9ZZZZ
MSSRNVISGTGNGEFSPEATITRAQFATILARLSGDDLSGQAASVYSDASAGDWFFQAAQWANQTSISTGSGGKFNPNEGITREQMAVMLYRYAKYKGYDVSIGEDTNILSYNDSLSISNYAYASLQWACGAEIIQGDHAGNLNPNGCATRAQAAAILQRFIDNVAD